MYDIIDFCLEEGKNIKEYEVTYHSNGNIEVTFTMTNGDTETFFETCED